MNQIAITIMGTVDWNGTCSRCIAYTTSYEPMYLCTGILLFDLFC